MSYTTQVNQPPIMEVSTLGFDYGNGVTALGMIGIVSTFIILVSVFRSFIKSPLNK